MIPKKLHYAWFGSEKPDYLIQNIKSWKKNLPDYEIIEWNETNWNVNNCAFSQYFYQKKQYGFVTDPLRVDVLKKYGGIYVDADVTIHKNLDRFLDSPMFLGLHFTNALGTAIIGSEKNNKTIDEIYRFYQHISYENILDENFDKINNGIFTRYFINKYPEFQMINKKQKLSDGTMIFPKQYFVLQKPLGFDRNNYAVHANLASWDNNIELADRRNFTFALKKIARFVLGKKIIEWRSNNIQMKKNSLYEVYRNRGKK